MKATSTIGKHLARYFRPASFSSTKLSEVLSSFGNNIFKKFENDCACRFAADVDVEEYSRIAWVCKLHFKIIFVTE